MHYSRALCTVCLCLISCYRCDAVVTQKDNPRQVATAPGAGSVSETRTIANFRHWGDQGDGTYANPVMPGDFSDLDAIRVGSDFYAISSTMQFSPGVVILQSTDLVNWKITGHVVSDLTTIDPELGSSRMSRAGRGVWAGAIRFHAGRFWVYFGTPDQGIFMSQAVDPAGSWTPPQLVLAGPGWDDPCPLWDDGRVYLVATHFSPEGSAQTRYNIHLFEMNTAGDHLLRGSDTIIHQSEGSEANKLYKINGLYYHLYSEVRPEGRVVMMERSHSLAGPWETHQLIHVNPAVDKEPNQGGLVELSSHRWYFVSHQGRGDWEGRAGVLLPVTWINGWPILGQVGPDGIGQMAWRGTNPIRSSRTAGLSTSDSFDGPLLNPAWEWNYQPRPGTWSLNERPGYLRLHAYRPIRHDDFKTVGNVLTQRALRSRRNEVTVKLDLSGMVDHQESGLVHFARTYCTLAVVQHGRQRRLFLNDDGKITVGPLVHQKAIYLRSNWNFNGRSWFSYSFDGIAYHPLGGDYQLTWGSYRGDRVGMFTTNSVTVSGFVDIAFFKYRIEH